MKHLQALQQIEQALKRGEDVREEIAELAKKFKSFQGIDPQMPTDQLIKLIEQARRNREALEAKDIFTSKDAAEYLDITETTVRYHTAYSKLLRGELISPRLRVFRRDELDRFLAEGKKKGPKPAAEGARKKSNYYDLRHSDEEVNQPEEFDKLSSTEQEALKAWIAEHIENYSLKKYASYGLKLEFERSPGGFYVTNGAFKGAMLAMGYKPVDEIAINWKFKK